MPMRPLELGTPVPLVRFNKEELRERLDPIQFSVTQEKGTERPFKNKYYKHYEDGVYTCVVCGVRLFDSDTKYESGSGWPSFYDVLRQNKINTRPDTSGVGGNLLRIVSNPGLIRTEVTCKRCGSHLGHVFKDGPQPTGLRYCVNSSSLSFVPVDEDVPSDDEEQEQEDQIDGVEQEQEERESSPKSEKEWSPAKDEDEESDTAKNRESLSSARKSFFSSLTSKNNKKNNKKKKEKNDIISFPATLGGCGPDGMCAIRPKNKSSTPNPTRVSTPAKLEREEKEQSV